MRVIDNISGGKQVTVISSVQVIMATIVFTVPMHLATFVFLMPVDVDNHFYGAMGVTMESVGNATGVPVGITTAGV